MVPPGATATGEPRCRGFRSRARRVSIDGARGDVPSGPDQSPRRAHATRAYAPVVALRSEDLDTALAQVSLPRPWFVPDAAGTGTTLYVAAYDEFDPRFGPGSRDAHLDAGADELADVPVSVRHDVDDLDDLHAAVALGIGARTAAVVPQQR